MALKSKVFNATSKILSSDTIRREALGVYNLDKHDPRMGYASEEAFAIMENLLRSYTTFPINNDFIILDATFLNKENRDKFRKIAKDNQYHVVAFVFDYKDRDSYFTYNNKGHYPVISAHLKRFKETTMAEIYKRDYDAVYKVKSHDFSLEIEDDPSYKEHLKSMLPLGDKVKYNRYFVIGDVHGCYDELEGLLKSVGFNIESGRLTGNDDTLVILLGDIVDKGPKLNEVINFVLANQDRVKTIIGNHENFLYKYFKGQIPSLPAKEIMDDYFDSTKRLTPEYIEKLNKIVESSPTFYYRDNIYITHAPCKNKYLGKYDSVSQKNMRNVSYPREREYPSFEEFQEAAQKHFDYIETESRKNAPLHIFGHVAVRRAFALKNKIFLDSGCVNGDALTGVFVYPNSDNYHFKFFKSTQTKKEKSLSLFNKADRDNSDLFVSLEYEDKMDILKYARNKVNFISGTVSPCDKNLETGDLENLREAFVYYKSKGVDRVVLQRKYMGSRANMYLFPHDISKSYMTSRNGFLIKKLDLTKLFEKMAKKFTDSNINLVIIDGELMPWSALGKGLIKGTFGVVDEGIRSELELLKSTGFEDKMNEARNAYSATSFAHDINTMKKEEVKKKYGEGVYRTYSALADLSHHPVSELVNCHQTYHEQMEIFGSEKELEFKPFAMLKVVYNDGSEKLFFEEGSNAVMFGLLSDDSCCVVELNDERSVQLGHDFYEKVTRGEKCEGVVVKPDKVYNKGIAPFLKVRNLDYLTIIYGYDLNQKAKMERMIKHKNVAKKISVSIKEFEYGKRMLEIPYDSISKDNMDYLNACAAMVIEEKNEKFLDPRL